MESIYIKDERQRGEEKNEKSKRNVTCIFSIISNKSVVWKKGEEMR